MLASAASLQVVAAALAQGGEEELHQLVQKFRQVFVVACQPKYLPANWAVDAVDTRQFGEYSVYAREESEQSEAAAEVGEVPITWPNRDPTAAAAVKGNGEADVVDAEKLSIFGQRTG